MRGKGITFDTGFLSAVAAKCGAWSSGVYHRLSSATTANDANFPGKNESNSLRRIAGRPKHRSTRELPLNRLLEERGSSLGIQAVEQSIVSLICHGVLFVISIGRPVALGEERLHAW